MHAPKPVLLPSALIILDGFGIAPPGNGNAISRAKTPFLDSLVTTYPTYSLQASGGSVGLPWGEMGNSEVGHSNIGAGRVLYQDLPRIDNAIADKSFFSNEVLCEAVTTAKKRKSTVHLVGLFSAGHVHASDKHMIALLDLCRSLKVSKVAVHVILDGRDVERNTGKQYVANLQKFLNTTKSGKIATVSGRFYAMDRDNHWERIQKTYDAMVKGASTKTYDDPVAAIGASYAQNVFDEEFEPVVIVKDGEPLAKVEDEDTVIFANFRADRARQLTMAFTLPGFAKFERGPFMRNLFFVTMSEYDRTFPVRVAFPPAHIENPLSGVLADMGLRQLHIAETEKYAHVTYFFDGGRDEPFSGEEYQLVPSLGLQSYAAKPGMSADGITEQVLESVKHGKHDVYVVNFANADMVGHSGDVDATVDAIEHLDASLKKITNAILEKGGSVFITADHGNAEEKLNVRTGSHLKEHSTNPVPFLVVAEPYTGVHTAPSRDLSALTPVGVLADVAPTMLMILGIIAPPDMTGTPLLHPLR